MLYNDKLEKARCKLTTRGALKYILQTQEGFFIASNGDLMLIEKNNMPFINKYWLENMPVECAEDWPDWRACIKYHTDLAVNFFNDNNIKKHKNGLIDVNGFYISANYYKIISDFIGSDINIKTPENVGTAIYFYNDDKSKEGLLITYYIDDNTRYNVLNDDGSIFYTTNNLEEAESFGMTVKVENV